MTISEAIEILEKKKSQQNDKKIQNRLDSLINDLTEYFGKSEEIDSQIAEKISNSNSLTANINYVWVMQLNEEFLQAKSSLDYEKQSNDGRKKVEKFKQDRDGLKLQREKAVKKNAKAKKIIFWITISLVLAIVITTCVFAIVQWIQKGKGLIDEPNWDMMALAGILDAFVGVIGFGIERVSDYLNSKEIRDIDRQEEEIYNNFYGDLYIQNNRDSSTGFQNCTFI